MNRTVTVVTTGLALALAGAVFAAASGQGIARASGAASTAQPAQDAQDAEKTPGVQDQAERPSLILVKFHADWCPSCRALQRPYDIVSAQLATDDILFVQVDRTDKTKAHQARLHLNAIGLGEHWEEFGNKTGQMVLFDGDTGEVVRVYNARNISGDLTAQVRGLLDA